MWEVGGLTEHMTLEIISKKWKETFTEFPEVIFYLTNLSLKSAREIEQALISCF